ncbi:MAG TPA: 2OG-Fe(II) oxygenase [Reyranella sp.]|nr:2OG-Fe(II) oxygenase [Reyranella sp.]
MPRPIQSLCVAIGDPMPRVTLPTAGGALFDSWDPTTAGMARVYWPGSSAIPPGLGQALAACDTLLHVVDSRPADDPSWLVDRGHELERAFAATAPLAIVVDTAGRVAALVPSPTAQAITNVATAFYRASTAAIVQAKAPVLMLERVAEPALCRALIDYWQRSDKRMNEVGSSAGNVVNDDVKRRQDVQVDEPDLLTALRDGIVRRIVPAMQQAFHARIAVIEAPLVGCYDATGGGWFRRHRDNTSRANAHRQFALSLNLNAGDEYEGGAVRFPEYGRELYRPDAGSALVFSCSLLHEAEPVIRGRRFGVFSFLSATGPLPPQARR